MQQMTRRVASGLALAAVTVLVVGACVEQPVEPRIEVDGATFAKGGSGGGTGGGKENAPGQLRKNPPPVISVSVDPSSATVAVNATQQFAAIVTGSTNTSVTWSASCGTISGTGSPVTWTAPGTAGTCTVTATSVADNTKSAAATVTVTPVISISISPTSADVAVDGTQEFTATVTGSGNTSVTWSETCGTISGTGSSVTWTAPSSVPDGGTCTVTATSVADVTKSAAATVTVTSGGGGGGGTTYTLGIGSIIGPSGLLFDIEYSVGTIAMETAKTAAPCPTGVLPQHFANRNDLAWERVTVGGDIRCRLAGINFPWVSPYTNPANIQITLPDAWDDNVRQKGALDFVLTARHASLSSTSWSFAGVEFLVCDKDCDPYYFYYDVPSDYTVQWGTGTVSVRKTNRFNIPDAGSATFSVLFTAK